MPPYPHALSRFYSTLQRAVDIIVNACYIIGVLVMFAAYPGCLCGGNVYNPQRWVQGHPMPLNNIYVCNESIKYWLVF